MTIFRRRSSRDPMLRHLVFLILVLLALPLAILGITFTPVSRAISVFPAVSVGTGTFGAGIGACVNQVVTAVNGGGVAPTCSNVSNAMLTGPIPASLLVQTDITKLGTITQGVWNGTPIQWAFLAPPLTILLTGSGSGVDYTTAGAGFVDVDAANLKTTTTVPVGAHNLVVQATFCIAGTPIVDGANHVRVLAAGSSISPMLTINNGILSPIGCYFRSGFVASPPPGPQVITLQFASDGVQTLAIRNPAVNGSEGGVTGVQTPQVFAWTN